MNKFKLLMCVAAGCLAFTSCDDDDDNGENLTTDLTGTYELSRLQVPVAQDLDSDGDSNQNLVLEGTCHNTSWISLKSDGTYEQGWTYSVLADGGASLDCETQMQSGTWEQDGNTITTTRLEGEGSASMTLTFDADDHTLTMTDDDANYVGWDNDASLFTELTGDLQLEFMKYTENEDSNGNGQDDDDNVDTEAMGEVAGNFDLTGFIVGEAQDLDNDGDSSTNLALENNCFTSSNITFDADGTYEQTVAQTILANAGTVLQCDTHVETGTWIRQGDRIITRHLEGDVNVNTEYVLNTSTNVLTVEEDDMQYPTFNTVTDLFALVTGSVDLSYERD
jgi:hypothetical protein